MTIYIEAVLWCDKCNRKWQAFLKPGETQYCEGCKDMIRLPSGRR